MFPVIAKRANFSHFAVMGFHCRKEHIVDGSIDNRVKGTTILQINFSNHTSSVITLKGNPCRDLAGSLWAFRNPDAQRDAGPGGEGSVTPKVDEGRVGQVSYASRRETPTLPVDEHYAQLFDDNQEDPPTTIVPVLELEWFSEEHGQVEICYDGMEIELMEMVWAMTAEEAATEMKEADRIRDRFYEEMSFDEDEDEDDFDEEIELHVLEERCFLIVQEFVINSADDSEAKKALHRSLLKLQEEVAEAFGFYTNEGTFEDIPGTIKLLGGVLPFIDRAAASAQYAAETTVELLAQLKVGIVTLRDELAQATDQ
ncbi:hypothetical protein V2O64_17590 [Verrucomicrobiaceae bacterium 227]